MKTLYIHMGTHKTGTSALQVYFAKNAKNLFEQGVYYAHRRSLHAARQARITSGNGMKLAQYFANRPTEKVSLSAFRSDFKSARGRHILYSSEAFHVFDEERVKAFTQFAASQGYAIKCIFFVRSPVGYALSQYSQVLKRHLYTHDFEYYLKNRFGLPFPNIKRAINCFGSDNVVIENYDHNRKDLAQYFATTILAVNTDGFETFDASINRSLTPFELELMRYANTMSKDIATATYISDALLDGTFDSRQVPKITKQHFDLVSKKFQPQLKYINSLGVNPPIKMKDDMIKIGDVREFTLSAFQKSIIAVLHKLAMDQVKNTSTFYQLLKEKSSKLGVKFGE